MQRKICYWLFVYIANRITKFSATVKASLCIHLYRSTCSYTPGPCMTECVDKTTTVCIASAINGLYVMNINNYYAHTMKGYICYVKQL